MSHIQSFSIKPGIRLHYIPETKFKKNYITIHLHNELNQENAAKCALLSDVLSRGCKKFPDENAISKHLQNLYGAVFSLT